MAYQRLTPGQEEQILKMGEDGKNPEEIVAYFKQTYSIKLAPWKISYIKSKVKNDLRGGVKLRKPRGFPGKKEVAVVSGPEDEVDIQELVSLLKEIDSGYKSLLAHFKNTLKNLRAELVKSRGEVREMMRGAGISGEEEG